MAITERQVFVPTILEDGQIQLRTDTIYEKAGVEIARTHFRQVLEPGQDVSTQSSRIKAICAAVWTPDVVKAFADARALLQLQQVR